MLLMHFGWFGHPAHKGAFSCAFVCSPSTLMGSASRTSKVWPYFEKWLHPVFGVLAQS
jgi:hypothetical protein